MAVTNMQDKLPEKGKEVSLYHIGVNDWVTGKLKDEKTFTINFQGKEEDHPIQNFSSWNDEVSDAKAGVANSQFSPGQTATATVGKPTEQKK